MIVGGLVSLITGLIMVIWPDKTLLFFAALIGAWLLVAGVMRIVQAVTRKDLGSRRRALLGVIGLLYVILALVCFANPFDSLALFTVIVGLVWTIGGAVEVAANFPKPVPTLLGVLSIAVGLTVFLWPEPTLTVMATIIGVWLIVIGLIQLGQALLTRRRTPSPESP